jgi:hypothetical protein
MMVISVDPVRKTRGIRATCRSGFQPQRINQANCWASSAYPGGAWAGRYVQQNPAFALTSTCSSTSRYSPPLRHRAQWN